MESSYAHVILFSLLGGMVSLVGGVFLLRSRRSAQSLAQYATPFAAGALLAAVFLDLLKEGMAESQPDVVLLGTLAGILTFFLGERFLRWFHHHHEHTDKKSDPKISLIVAGDTLHNAMDGVAIAAAFLINVPTGMVTTLAVALHEIPQEIGDFGLLLKRGMSRRRVLLVNLVSALATTAMAILIFWLGSADALPIGLLLGISAGFLLYIALSDIIPDIHRSSSNKKVFDIQPLLLLLGVLLVGLAISLSHHFIGDHHHQHSHHTNIVQKT